MQQIAIKPLAAEELKQKEEGIWDLKYDHLMLKNMAQRSGGGYVTQLNQWGWGMKNLDTLAVCCAKGVSAS